MTMPENGKSSVLTMYLVAYTVTELHVVYTAIEDATVSMLCESILMIG